MMLFNIVSPLKICWCPSSELLSLSHPWILRDINIKYQKGKDDIYIQHMNEFCKTKWKRERKKRKKGCQPPPAAARMLPMLVRACSASADTPPPTWWWSSSSWTWCSTPPPAWSSTSSWTWCSWWWQWLWWCTFQWSWTCLIFLPFPRLCSAQAGQRCRGSCQPSHPRKHSGEKWTINPRKQWRKVNNHTPGKTKCGKGLNGNSKSEKEQVKNTFLNCCCNIVQNLHQLVLQAPCV